MQTADRLINEAIQRKELPGAVLLVGQGDKIVYRKAYGLRTADPQPVPMTPDTIFDMASLTKTVACATSVMMLVERGKLSLADKVAKYIPAFRSQRQGAHHRRATAPAPRRAGARQLAGRLRRWPRDSLGADLEPEARLPAGHRLPLQRHAATSCSANWSRPSTAADRPVRSRGDLPAAGHEGHRCTTRRKASGAAAPPPRSATASGWSGRCTTRGPGPSAAWPVMPACSAPPTIWPAGAG